MNKKKFKPKFDTDVYIDDDAIKIHIKGHANIHLKSKDGKKQIQKKWKIEKNVEIGLREKISEDMIDDIIRRIEENVEKRVEEMKERFADFLDELREKWIIVDVE